MNHKNYPEPDISADKAWADMKKKLNNKPGKLPTELYSKPVAAKFFLYAGIGLIFILITAYYFLKEKQQKLQPAVTHYSHNKPERDTLPDGTVAFLNKYSSISEITNAAKEKIITIMGSAYFNEEQFSTKPQHRLKVGSIDVLPVKANIYVSFDSVLAISSVHVQSGSAVITIDSQILTLNTGEAIQYDETYHQMSKKQKADVNLFNFATNIFIFSDTPLKDAAEAIANAYGIIISFENTKLYNCRITTRFDNKSLKEILDIMTYTLNFKYHQDEKNNRIVITGDGCE